jgi:ABC-2 type transport system permease protein
MDSLRLYFKMIRVSALARMQYRADFLTGAVGVIVWNAASLGLIGILIHQFGHLNGWTIWELVFLYSLWNLGHSLFSLLFWHIHTLEDYLIEGTFDWFLIRPLSPLLQLFGREVHYMGLADMLIGVTGVGLAYTALGLRWESGQWAFFFLAVASGALIEMALTLMVACIAFWTGRSRAGFFVVMQFNGLVEQYPVDIFGGWFRVVVTGLIPVAFMNYYPALTLLDKIDPRDAWAWLGYASPLVALALAGLASIVWRLALRQYASSGS